MTTGLASVSSADVVEVNLEVVSRSDLQFSGLYGDVTVVGTTAVVATEAAGSPCPSSSAKVVDMKDPGKPRVVSAIALPPGTTAADIDSATVASESFTGDVVALALTPLPACGDATGAMVVFHDITDPAHPKLLGQSAPCPGCRDEGRSVTLAARSDGGVLASRTNTARPGVAIDDVSDPARPSTLGQWSDPVPVASACVGAGGSVTARLTDDGQEAVVVLPDGRVYDLDLTNPAAPAGSGEAAVPAEEPARGRAATHAAIMPLGNRTLAIVSEEGLDDGCPGIAPAHGLRVLAMERGVTPREQSPVRFPSPAAPGRLVASGSLAYVTWHGDGLRVIDFGEVRARTVAQFIPSQPDVVGVALLPQHVVITDLTSGLYVLERPEEGGGRAGFWSQFLSLLPYLAFAGVAAAAFVVPRLAMGRAPVGAGSPVPSPERARRRA
ncbi:MAG TPA: hypothetical protein VGV86_05240 [Acidimicrobiales bacterium]|nr:hypothetical protein [Acidimicrobiales bacterium]